MVGVQRCSRLVFSRFFDIRGNLGNVKEKPTKLVFPVKWSAWLYASTLQNFARRHFFNVNEVSIVISWEGDVETGDNIWKVLKTKAHKVVAWLVAGKKSKLAAETQCYLYMSRNTIVSSYWVLIMYQPVFSYWTELSIWTPWILSSVIEP